MSEIAKCALKTSLVGAGIGLVVGVAQGAIRLRSNAEQQPSADVASLSKMETVASIQQFDPDLHHIVIELGGFRKYHADAFERMCSNINNMISKYQLVHTATEPINPGIAYSANRYVAKTIEAVRELRKRTEHAAPARIHAFDESAAKIQETLNNYNYNIIMEMQARLDKK